MSMYCKLQSFENHTVEYDYFLITFDPTTESRYWGPAPVQVYENHENRKVDNIRSHAENLDLMLHRVRLAPTLLFFCRACTKSKRHKHRCQRI